MEVPETTALIASSHCGYGTVVAVFLGKIDMDVVVLQLIMDRDIVTFVVIIIILRIGVGLSMINISQRRPM